MPVLYLMRHAQAGSNSSTGEDFHRELAYAGTIVAPLMGREMSRRNWLPEQVIVSPATRTTQTWQLILPELGNTAPAVQFDERLYDSTAGSLLEIIRETPETVQSLLIIGHNPGLHELAIRLSGDASDVSAFSILRQSFLAGAIARFEFDGDWKTLNPWQPYLTDFLRPNDIEQSDGESNQHGFHTDEE